MLRIFNAALRKVVGRPVKVSFGLLGLSTITPEQEEKKHTITGVGHGNVRNAMQKQSVFE